MMSVFRKGVNIVDQAFLPDIHACNRYLIRQQSKDIYKYNIQSESYFIYQHIFEYMSTLIKTYGTIQQCIFKPILLGDKG